MANHKSAAKKARRDVEARLRNRSNRSTLKTAVKKFLTVLSEGNKAEATKLLPLTQGQYVIGPFADTGCGGFNPG